MKIQRIEVKNFRILKEVILTLEDTATVIVGRNNSGKTSLTELFRRLLSENSPKFLLEDFSLSSHDLFWEAFKERNAGKQDEEILKCLPIIEVSIYFNYNKGASDLGTLGDFIIDLNVDSTEAIAIIKYQLRGGGIDELFNKLKCIKEKNIDKQKRLFLREIKERIPQLYITTLTVQDPNDSDNQKSLDLQHLRTLLQVSFINAQRGLDDTTQREKDVLGKILERLLLAASSEEADEKDQAIVTGLEDAVQGIQESLDSDFTERLGALLNLIKQFYGLGQTCDCIS